MDDRLVIARRDLDGRVLGARRRAADQERHIHAATLHFAGDVHHLVERRRDQAAQADDVGLLLDGRIEDLVGRHHHAQVDHLEVVAAQDDADDVLADVVHVPLHGRHHDRAAILLGRSVRSFSASMKGVR